MKAERKVKFELEMVLLHPGKYCSRICFFALGFVGVLKMSFKNVLFGLVLFCFK